jgi:pimeloyl-ACP methyl ester carboxylesterase
MMIRAVALNLMALIFGVAPIWSQRSPSQHRTYVLVHGATGGSWDWRTLDSILTSHGQEVIRPSLTGLGERVHLASPDIRLATHIDDVVNAILWDDLHDVILVGHSYGGMVIAGVADRIPQRIRRLVYLDAFLPDSGETALELAQSIGARSLLSHIRDGFIVPAGAADTQTIPRDVPQPLRTFTDTLRLTNPAARRIPGTYILTVEKGETTDAFDRFARRAKERGWPVIRMTADHIPERSAPNELAALLERIR